MSFLLGVPGSLKTLKDRLTAARAGWLDRLQYVTQARMEKLDALNGATSRAVEFTTPGVQSWTVPANVSLIYVTGVGAGGGGGGCSNAGSAGPGGGGGSGMSAYRYPLKVTPGQQLSLTIGAGGAGGTIAATGVAGGAGGSTIVDALLALPGGGGGAGGQSNGNGGDGGSYPYLRAGQSTHLPGALIGGLIGGAYGGNGGISWGGGIGQFDQIQETGSGAASYFGSGGSRTVAAGKGGGGAGGVWSGVQTGFDGGNGWLMIEWVGG